MRPLLLLVLLTLLAPALRAEEPAAGFVKTLSGGATITRGADNTPAAVGSPVQVGDVLRTGADGRLGLTLKDDTRMAIGPDTTLELERFMFEPARDKLGLATRLGRGTLDFISGTIAKLKPEAVSIRTPEATIGVRGTHFAVKVSE